MATFTVNTAVDEVADDSRLSLREAVARANARLGADSIGFAPGLEGRTLALQGGQLRVTDDLRIDGNRDGNRSEVTIDGGGRDRVLLVAGDATAVRLEDLTITGGADGNGEGGGGIYLAPGNDLRLTGCTIEGNRSGVSSGFPPSYGFGGGIYAGDGSRLTITNTLLRGNAAGYGFGGAILGSSDVTVVARGSEFSGNYGYWAGGAISLGTGSSLAMTACVVQDNAVGGRAFGGGGLFLYGGEATIRSSTLFDNRSATYGGGVSGRGSRVALIDSTLSGNHAATDGGGVSASVLVLRNSTLTGNRAAYDGGGIAGRDRLEVANSIVAGNFVGDQPRTAADIEGSITASDGHNIFGSEVAGTVPGDLENVAPGRLFAALDTETGGGRLELNGGPTPTVRLRDVLGNPALSGADPRDAGTVDQRGVDRPLPVSNPDVGAFELDQRQVSRSPSVDNDVLTGGSGADALAGLAGRDLVRGRGGNDTLRGQTGSDTLDGGAGADRLEGGSAHDLLRGGENDDRLLGGLHQDMLLGGNGSDRFDFDPGDTGVGAERRDVILDFGRPSDRIDLLSIDAVTGGANDAFAFIGRQAFSAAGQLRFVQADGATIVQGNTDPDAAPELEVELAGAVTLGAEDFLL